MHSPLQEEAVAAMESEVPEGVDSSIVVAAGSGAAWRLCGDQSDIAAQPEFVSCELRRSSAAGWVR